MHGTNKLYHTIKCVDYENQEVSDVYPTAGSRPKRDCMKDHT